MQGSRIFAETKKARAAGQRPSEAEDFAIVWKKKYIFFCKLYYFDTAILKNKAGFPEKETPP